MISPPPSPSPFEGEGWGGARITKKLNRVNLTAAEKLIRIFNTGRFYQFKKVLSTELEDLT